MGDLVYYCVMHIDSLPTRADRRQRLHIDIYNALVLELRRYMQREGLNQTELAVRLKVSKGYISRLLNGTGDPKLSSILDLALAIGKEPVLMFTDQPLPKAYELPELDNYVVNDPSSDYGNGDTSNRPFVERVNWAAVSDLPILQKLSRMKKEIDAMRPFSRNMERHVVNQMIRNWHYNTNAIEGNKLTYGETLALLMHGVTAKGKPLKDHLDIIGHRDAVDLMLAMVKETDKPLRQTDIRQLHQIMLKEDYQQKAVTATGREVFRLIRVGVYKREPNHVMTSKNKKHYYAEPAAVPALVEDLVDWHGEAERSATVHPLVRAAVLHHEFVAIHPFDDGNGRITRLLMNFSLMRAGYPLVVVPVDDRLDYYRALERADQGDFCPLVEFLGRNLYNSLDIMLATARGEDIGGSKWDTIDDDPR